MIRTLLNKRYLYCMLLCMVAMVYCERTIGQVIQDSTSAVGLKQFYKEILPKPLGYVSDYENLYTAEQETFMDSLISNFKTDTHIEIALISIDTTMTTKDSLDAFAVHIASAWGVGESIANNGILVAISSGLRRMRIVNGYGIEKILPDNETKELIDNYFIPKFKTGDYFTGTVDGLGALIRRLKKNLKEH